MANIIDKWKQQVKKLKSEVIALYYAYRDPRVKWYAKLLIIVIVGYAFSPIDLVPDFIPILGYLDDFILIPLGVALAIKLIPPIVMEEARAKSKELSTKPRNWLAALVILAIWLAILAWVLKIILTKA